MKHRIPTVAALCGCLMLPVGAQAADLEVSGVNLYLIWENSGKLSKNMAAEDHVTTVSEEGAASQVLMDVVVTGAPDTLYEDVPTLRITVARAGGGVLAEKAIPITYIQTSGKLYTTVVIEHGCEPFSIEAHIERGGSAGPSLVKDVGINCGD